MFDAVAVRSPLPVLVDLWAPWCGPCRTVTPMVERLAAERAGRLKVVEVNVDEAPGTASRYGVQGIPTLLLMSGGTVRDRLVGALPEPRLRQRVDALLDQAAGREAGRA
jgi:thioredoxin 2